MGSAIVASLACVVGRNCPAVGTVCQQHLTTDAPSKLRVDLRGSELILPEATGLPKRTGLPNCPTAVGATPRMLVFSTEGRGR